MRRAVRYLRDDIWRIRSHEISRRKSLWLRPTRVLVLAVRHFGEDRGQLRASALTFYTLLSIVPVLAVAFAFAQGFGFEERFANIITTRLQGHEEIAGQIITFARSQLERTRGGFVAGFGVVLLLWSVYKLLTHVERSFNEVWGTRDLRPFGRRVLDHVAIMVLGPILLVVNSSLTVLLTRQADFFSDQLPRLGWLSSLATSLAPAAGVLVFLTLMFRYLPNTQVSFRAALVGGAVAAALYHALQWAYLTFQFWMSGYNAIYGSFAALPRFLIWIQLSWLIVLFGVELSFATENEVTYEFGRESARASRRFRTLLALRIAALCTRRFRDGATPPTDNDITRKLGLPVRLARQVLTELRSARILTCVRSDDDRLGYRPGMPIHQLTVHRVLTELDRLGSADLPVPADAGLQAAESILATLDEGVAHSDANVHLVDLESRLPASVRGERTAPDAS